MSVFDAIEAQVIVDRMLAQGWGNDARFSDDDYGDVGVDASDPFAELTPADHSAQAARTPAQPDYSAPADPNHPDRYIAYLALNETEEDVAFVEALNDQCRRVSCPDDDVGAVASLQRLAHTAWLHQRRARRRAEGAAWDPVVGPLAARVVARGERAVRSIACAASRAVTRAAIRARRAARARLPIPAPRVRPVTGRLSRPRAVHVRRVRLSAVASAGSGADEPSPEPPRRRDRVTLTLPGAALAGFTIQAPPGLVTVRNAEHLGMTAEELVGVLGAMGADPRFRDHVVQHGKSYRAAPPDAIVAFLRAIQPSGPPEERSNAALPVEPCEQAPGTPASVEVPLATTEADSGTQAMVGAVDVVGPTMPAVSASPVPAMSPLEDADAAPATPYISAAVSISDSPSPQGDAPTPVPVLGADGDSGRPEPLHDDAPAQAVAPNGSPAEDSAFSRLCRVYEETKMPANTRRMYRDRFAKFIAWCDAGGHRPMPALPEVLRAYLLALAIEKKSFSTINLSRAAVLKAHEVLGYAPPDSEPLRATVRDLRRSRDTQEEPIQPETLKAIVGACKGDRLARRDRALLLVTYYARLRRGETVSLDRERVQVALGRYLVRVRKGEGDPVNVGVPAHSDPLLCPVRALDEWLAERGQLTCTRQGRAIAVRGPLFFALRQNRPDEPLIVGQRLSPQDVDRILKRRAKEAGIDPATVSADHLRARLDTRGPQLVGVGGPAQGGDAGTGAQPEHGADQAQTSGLPTGDPRKERTRERL
jgi:site-specific recombinase XerD